ncbi:snoaL-like domain protein [Rhodococcus sp. Br-6]|nr:snoaL-like domain protein [Rhodococcus sp. Br-6]
MGDPAPVPAIEPAWCEEFVQRWITAWNAHDADQVLGLLTDDIVWDDPAWPRTMYGKAEARELLAHNWRAFPT